MKTNSCRHRKSANGFSLIELMVVVVILAVLAGLAGPSFSEMIASQRVRAAASALYDSLLLARSEAIKRNNTVSLAASSGDLRSGWNVFLADGATSIRNQEAFSSGLTFNPVAPTLTYSGLGRLVSGSPPTPVTSPVTVTISGSGTTKQWTVLAEASGRVCVVEGGTSC